MQSKGAYLRFAKIQNKLYLLGNHSASMNYVNMLERVRPVMVRAIYYGAVGLSCSLLDFTLFTIVVTCANFPVLVVNACTYVVGTLVSFQVNARKTFHRNDKMFCRGALFFVAALLGLGVSSLLLHLAHKLGVSVVAMKVFSMGAVFIVQFSFNNFITFR